MTDLLQIARDAAPEYRWEYAYQSTERVIATIDFGHWLNIEQSGDGLIVAVSRLQRETPAGEGNDIDRFYTGRRYCGGELATMVAQAAADSLAPTTVAGIVLWPTDRLWSGVETWTDDSGRYVFQCDLNGKYIWKYTGETASKIARLIDGAYGTLGGQADTLPQAVADAMDAPRRIAALLHVLNIELLSVPSSDPWTYAAVVQAHDGERAVAGPCDTMLDLKTQLRWVEKPFIGRMNTDASYIVAVPDHLAADADAWALIVHPSAVRLKR